MFRFNEGKDGKFQVPAVHSKFNFDIQGGQKNATFKKTNKKTIITTGNTHC